MELSIEMTKEALKLGIEIEDLNLQATSLSNIGAITTKKENMKQPYQNMKRF